ncbi:MAG: hypothetical protein AB1758_23440 [Candidatus Eremiobacterota bacterium]
MRKSEAQRRLRQRRGERAFLFDPALSRCLGEVERERWEEAMRFCGGNVARAAAECGLEVPRSARALWGRSAADALDCHRGWLRRKVRRK